MSRTYFLLQNICQFEFRKQINIVVRIIEETIKLHLVGYQESN